MKIMYAMPSIAPTFVGKTYQLALERLAALTQEWLRFYLGRKEGRRVNTTDLATRHKQILADVAKLAEAEKQSSSVVG